jgi:hypothetical protein
MARTDPGRLPRSVALIDDELTANYLMRTSWANGFASLDQFCKVAGWDSTAIGKSAPGVTALIAARTGNAVRHLGRYAISSGRVVQFGSDRVKRIQLETKSVRYCPVCVLLDHSSNPMPIVSAIFQWRAISHCPLHSCPIASVPGQVFRHLQCFDDLLSAGSDADPGALPVNVYFYNRIKWGPSDGFLGELPAYVAAEFCSLIGHIRMRMEAGSIKDAIQGGFSNDLPRELGFNVAINGYDAIWEFLSQHVRCVNHRISIPARIYSPFIRWHEINGKNPDYAEPFALLEKHAQRHIPLGTEPLFAVQPSTAHVHNITSASRHYGLSLERVRRVVGQPKRFASRAHLFRTSDFGRSLQEEAALISIREAAEILGCSTQLVGLIIEAGLLQPSGGRQGSPRRVHREHVSSLLATIATKINTCLEFEGLHPIEEVCRTFSRRRHQVVAALANGSLRHVAARPGSQGLGGILIDRHEVGWAVAQHPLNRVLEPSNCPLRTR